MLKEIPNKPNHKIVGYKEIPHLDGTRPSLYEPIYERIFPLNAVYWDNSRNELIHLISDIQGITSKGQTIEIDANQLEISTKVCQGTFYELLSYNGYKIKDGKLTFHLNYGCVYMTDMDVIVIYLADGCHTCTNAIVDFTIARPAETFETQAFLNCLKNNGYTYDSINQCITKSEKYYYFPSYSLYAGFQPEKKKWINSDADKFYQKHGEDFVNFNDCANFCNRLNRLLTRDYPEIKLEE